MPDRLSYLAKFRRGIHDKHPEYDEAVPEEERWVAKIMGDADEDTLALCRQSGRRSCKVKP